MINPSGFSLLLIGYSCLLPIILIEFATSWIAYSLPFFLCRALDQTPGLMYARQALSSGLEPQPIEVAAF